MDFKWTEELPSSSGWYWNKDHNGFVTMIHIQTINNELGYGETRFGHWSLSKENGNLWSGPIPEPIN